MLLAEPLTQQVIGLAIEVHRHLGPGLLESPYQQRLSLELRRAGIDFARQVTIPVVYEDEQIDSGFEAAIMVAQTLIKSVATILPVHEIQARTYLPLSALPVGLLNINAPAQPTDSSASSCNPGTSEPDPSCSPWPSALPPCEKIRKTPPHGKAPEARVR